MKPTNNGRPSLVEFLGSIKFSRDQAAVNEVDANQGHFARLQQHTSQKRREEDAQLIRSAN